MGTDELQHLPSELQFGFQIHSSSKDLVILSDDYFTIKKKSGALYKPYSVYSRYPLNSISYFEVEVSLASSCRVGQLMIGVCRFPKHSTISTYHPVFLPYESNNYCVWHNSALWNNFSAIHTKVSYGFVHLAEITTHDRIGVMITLSGDLLFYVNGRCQGLAARNIYLESCNVYAVVTMLESCESLCVVQSSKSC